MGEESVTPGVLAQTLAGARRLLFSNGRHVELATPIILDLDGKGVQTLPRSAGVRYDLDGDGLADATSWIGPTEGFLFLDRDGNGTVTNAAEFSFVADLPGAISDLQGLRVFDSSGDGVLSANDKRFADFRIWQDKNTNGVVDAGEILTLAAAAVRSINLSAVTYTGTTQPDDVAIIATGSYQRTAGTLSMEFLDAALTYTSAPRNGLPHIVSDTGTFDQKAGKYRLVAKDGGLSVVRKKGGDVVDSRAGGLLGSFELTFRNQTIGMLSALVLDLDGNGVSLTGLKHSKGWFDMNGDGSSDQQGWAGKRDGFLVIDRNANGIIDDASELSFLAEDPTARSSLSALTKLDSNGDAVLDKTDARFGELRVWIDTNSNGSTDVGELKSLSDLGIVSIGLAEHNRSSSVKPGNNVLLATAVFTYANGVVRTLGDAALAFRPSEPAPPPDTVNAAAALPLPDSVQPAPDESNRAGSGGAVATTSAFFAGSAFQFAAAMSVFDIEQTGSDLNRAYGLDENYGVSALPGGERFASQGHAVSL